MNMQNILNVWALSHRKQKTLPFTYWIPKMHKNPTGTRFIIVSEICSTEQFFKSVFNVFKLLSQIENATFLPNYNKFWILQNADPIIQSLNIVNEKSVSNLLQHMTFRNYKQNYLMIN